LDQAQELFCIRHIRQPLFSISSAKFQSVTICNGFVQAPFASSANIITATALPVKAEGRSKIPGKSMPENRI